MVKTDSFENEEFIGELERGKKILPAYEKVKISILISWTRIEEEYEKYAYATASNRIFPMFRLWSKILTLYKIMLKPSMKAAKKWDAFIEEMDSYINKGFKIPEDKLEMVLQNMTIFLYDIGLTNISHEYKPWDERFRDSYGVF